MYGSADLTLFASVATLPVEAVLRQALQHAQRQPDHMTLLDGRFQSWDSGTRGREGMRGWIGASQSGGEFSAHVVFSIEMPRNVWNMLHQG